MLALRKRLVGGLAAVCIMAASACSEPTAPLESSADRPAAEAYRAAISRGIDTACSQLLACASSWGPLVPDLASCRALGPDIFDTGIDPSLLEVHQLDDAGFDQCMSSRTSGCAGLDVEVVTRCLQLALRGVLPEGTCCDSRGGCESGLACTAASDDVGLCWAVVGTGASCRIARCDSGLYCDAGGLCAPLPDAGSPCTPAGECAGDSFCNGWPGTCTALPGDGESCAATYACASDLRCDPADFVCRATAPEYCDLWTPCPEGQRCDSGTSSCVPLSALGESCTLDADCPPGATCVYEGTSSRACRAHALEGQSCSAIGYLAPPCAWRFGLECVDGTCVLGPTLDEPCVAGVDRCRPVASTYCDEATGACRERGALGEPCVSASTGEDESCVPGTTCSAELGVCLPHPEQIQSGMRCPP